MIIAVEGICCSGKSTLVSSLKAHKLKIVAEYGDYTSGKFPKLACNRTELLNSTHFFIELEQKRCQDAIDNTFEKKDLILDRSFLTCCAFDWAVFNHTNLAQHLHEVEKMWEETEEKLTPDLIILLTVTYPEFERRLKTSGKTLTPTLRDRDFNIRFLHYFRSVLDRWHIPVKSIDTSDSLPEEVLKIALAYLKL